ncbi:MAG: hypothetical protein NVV74_04900 [Magnetospirillum sp.]|nr:hypothetical protein [Magnetospirillum sp.]
MKGLKDKIANGIENRWFLALVLVCALGLYAQMTRSLIADDDNLWLLFASEKIYDQQLGLALENKVIALAREVGVDDKYIFRVDLRKNYGSNYRLPMLALGVINSLIDINNDITKYSIRLVFGISVIVVMPWIIFAYIYRHVNSLLKIATLFILQWFALSAFIDATPSVLVVFPGGLSSIGLGILNLLSFILNPGPAFSIFGVTPRNMLTVCITACLLARWSGCWRLSYLLLTIGIGLHTSLGIMVMLCIVAGDLIACRQRYRDPCILFCVAAGAVYGAWNERMFQMVAPGLGFLVALGATSALLFGVWWVRAANPAKLVPALQPAMATLDRMSAHPHSRVIQDLYVLGAALAFCTVTGAIGSLVASHDSIFYFWGQLPTRLYGAVGPAFLIGVAYLVFDQLERPTVVLLHTFFLVLVIASGLVFLHQKETPFHKVRAQMRAYERDLSAAASLKSHPAIDERIIYYELNRALDRRDRILAAAGGVHAGKSGTIGRDPPVITLAHTARIAMVSVLFGREAGSHAGCREKTARGALVDEFLGGRGAAARALLDRSHRGSAARPGLWGLSPARPPIRLVCHPGGVAGGGIWRRPAPAGRLRCPPW